MVLVTSTPLREDSLEQRETIRTCTHDSFVKWSSSWTNIFRVCRPKEVADESARHNDILVGNFKDTYINLIIKVLFSFEWASRVHCKFTSTKSGRRCAHALIPKFIKWLQLQEMPDRLYAGALEEDTGIVRLPWHSRTFHQLYNIQFL